jgi:hypothetical protein
VNKSNSLHVTRMKSNWMPKIVDQMDEDDLEDLWRNYRYAPHNDVSVNDGLHIRR